MDVMIVPLCRPLERRGRGQEMAGRSKFDGKWLNDKASNPYTGGRHVKTRASKHRREVIRRARPNLRDPRQMPSPIFAI
jgi:hypothetical protein